MKPQAGQLWRLRWEDVTHLALVASVADDYLTFWPATLDVDYADASALVIPAEDSGIGLAVAVWPALETGIGWYVLEQYVIQVLSAGQLQDVRRSYRKGERLPVKWAPGQPVADITSPRGQYRSDLVALTNFLGHATWEPKAS